MKPKLMVYMLCFLFAFGMAADRETSIKNAKELSYSGKYQQAIGIYDALLRENPNDLDVRIHKASVLSWAKAYDNAIIQYQLVLSKNPQYWDAEIGIIRVTFWKGNDKEAFLMAEKASQKYFDNIGVLNIYAEMLTHQSQYNKAIEVYKKVLILDNNSEEALFGISRLYYWAGDLNEAIKYAELVVGNFVDNVEAVSLLEKLHIKKNYLFVENNKLVGEASIHMRASGAYLKQIKSPEVSGREFPEVYFRNWNSNVKERDNVLNREDYATDTKYSFVKFMDGNGDDTDWFVLVNNVEYKDVNSVLGRLDHHIADVVFAAGITHRLDKRYSIDASVDLHKYSDIGTSFYSVAGNRNPVSWSLLFQKKLELSKLAFSYSREYEMLRGATPRFIDYWGLLYENRLNEDLSVFTSVFNNYYDYRSDNVQEISIALRYGVPFVRGLNISGEWLRVFPYEDLLLASVSYNGALNKQSFYYAKYYYSNRVGTYLEKGIEVRLNYNFDKQWSAYYEMTLEQEKYLTGKELMINEFQAGVKLLFN